MSTAQQQVEFLDSRIKNYFIALNEILLLNPPPAQNAANGWIREKVLTLVSYGDKNNLGFLHADGKTYDVIGLTGANSELFVIFNGLHNGIHEAFANNNNHYANISNPVVLLAHRQLIASALQIGATVVTAILAKNPQVVLGQLGEEIKALETEIEHKNITSTGAHLNGHISAAIKRKVGQDSYDLKQLASTGHTPAHKMADILEGFCAMIDTLPVDGHDPWLRADWQIGFTAAVQITIATLRARE